MNDEDDSILRVVAGDEAALRIIVRQQRKEIDRLTAEAEQFEPALRILRSVADESAERRRKSVVDVSRLRSLPFLEQLSDRGDAMKIVPLFAIHMMDEAKEFIDGMLVENTDLRDAIKHLGYNPNTFISRAKRRREKQHNGGTT